MMNIELIFSTVKVNYNGSHYANDIGVALRHNYQIA